MLKANKINITYSIQIIRWVLFIQFLLSVIYLPLIWFHAEGNNQVLMERLTGKYWFAYAFMYMGNYLFAPFLLKNNLGKNLLYIFITSVMMHIGWWLENLIIKISMFRDYLPNRTEKIISMFIDPYYLLFGSLIFLLLILIENFLLPNRYKK